MLVVLSAGASKIPFTSMNIAYNPDDFKDILSSSHKSHTAEVMYDGFLKNLRESVKKLNGYFKNVAEFCSWN